MTRCRSAGARLVQTLGLAAVLLSVLDPTAALAASFQPGVHGDPGSPAGKEYAFPIGTARSIAGGRGLFGVGITPPGPGGSEAPGPAGSEAQSRNSSGGTRSVSPAPTNARGSQDSVTGASGNRAEGTVRGKNRAGRRVGAAGVGSGVEWMFAAAMSVIALGALGGQVLARLGRRDEGHSE